MEQVEMAPVILSISDPATSSLSNCKSSPSVPDGVTAKRAAAQLVESLPRARGLTNLGNTCFFNACMQCLGQTPFLTTIFNEEVVHLPGGEFKSDDDTTIVIPPIKIEYSLHMDDMLKSFHEVMEQLQTSGSVLNPIPFFNKFTRQHPQFGGGDQHDSHELLRHVLDCVLVSEKRIFHQQLLAAMKASKRLQSDQKQKLEWYAAQSKDRFLIRRVFQGSLESTLRCEDCGNTSPNMETFLDISLPVSQMGANGTWGRAAPKVQSPERVVPNKRQLRKEKRATKRATTTTTTSAVKGNSTEEGSEAESDDETSDGERDAAVTTNGTAADADDIATLSETFGTFRLSQDGVTKLLHRHAAQSNGEHCRTIGEPFVNDSDDCNVQSCLNAFVASELLSGNNKVTCEACTKRLNGPDPKAKSVLTNATKQFLVSSLPAVLILHLKRFQMTYRHSFLKLSTEVNFPLILDMGPFCAANPQTAKEHRTVHRDQKHILYSLYGIVEHSGTMHTGHYIAYVKVRAKIQAGDPRWRFVSTLYNEKAKATAATNGHTDAKASSSSSSSDSDESSEAGDQSGRPPVNVEDVVPPPGKWYKISDSRVTETTEEKVLNAEAYCLFYERIF